MNSRTFRRLHVSPAGAPGRRPGFTLIELLVVLAIIAMLAGMLLPVLARAKASAKRVQCLGGLRQVALATQMYWEDNGGKTFRYRLGSTSNGTVYWFGWIESGAEGERAFDATQGVLWPYLQGKGVEFCAALNRHAANFKLKAHGATYGYGYNLSLSAAPANPAVAVSRVAAPSALAVFADAAQVNTFQSPASPEHPLLEEFYYVSANPAEATAHFRHGRRANVAFCDGHVGQERIAPGSSDTRLPEELVGRLRSEVLEMP
jgi:prepilin-type N-terminal cleavage/methylation domain-containing protein/prepilin-type processing-associated H-X9-DG protein